MQLTHTRTAFSRQVAFWYHMPPACVSGGYKTGAGLMHSDPVLFVALLLRTTRGSPSRRTFSAASFTRQASVASRFTPAASGPSGHSAAAAPSNAACASVTAYAARSRGSRGPVCDIELRRVDRLLGNSGCGSSCRLVNAISCTAAGTAGGTCLALRCWRPAERTVESNCSQAATERLGYMTQRARL